MRSSRGQRKNHPRLPSVPAARLKGHEGAILDIKFTQNGRYVLSAGQDRTVRLWNPTKLDPAFQPQQRCAYTRMQSHSNYGDSGDICFASIPTGALPCALPIKSYPAQHMYEVSSVSIDCNNKVIVSASGKAVFASDVMSGKLIRRFEGHMGRINTVDCNADGSVIFSGSYDGSVRCWDCRSNSRDPIQIFSEAKDSVTSILINENEIITASVDSKIRTYDVRMAQMHIDHIVESAALTSIAMSKDGQCLAVNCTDGVVRLLERSNGKVLTKYAGSHTYGQFGLKCAITSNDDYVVSGSEDGTVAIYDLVQGNIAQKLIGHSRPTCALSACPDRNRCSIIISGSYDGDVIVWSTPNDVKSWG